MPTSSPPWLERACGGLALLIMLVLLALTIGSPADAAPAPIIIIPTPALDTGAVLPPLLPRLHAPERRIPPDTLEALETLPPAREAPAPARPPAQQVPAMEVLAAPPAAQNAAPATAATRPSQLITEPDGTVRLLGVEDWMADLPPEPTAAPVPAASSPPSPRGGCAARRGCP